MSANSKRRILLVDDEALVRMVGADALAEAGYEVIEATNAAEALSVLQAIGEVEVLFTDIRMPGTMDGLELAKLVHEQWPSIKILVTSGDTWPTQAGIPLDGRFLPKPYRVESLQQEVDDLVRRRDEREGS